MIFEEGWPSYSEEALKADEIEIVLQVNGKVRDIVSVPVDISKEELEKRALENSKIKSHTGGKKIQKVIVVPGKLVNIVVN